IQDFSRSWRSGLAFCLLIHRHDPDLIPTLFQHDYLDNLGSKETWETLLSMAFDIAESHLNVPKYLEPEDLIDVEYPHEPSVMMYVSEMYKVMNSSSSLNDIEEKLEK
ncbi:calponin homology domain-containing protein, partial [Pilaira anomala]